VNGFGGFDMLGPKLSEHSLCFCKLGVELLYTF
jgi:hypothetical protein